MPRAGPAGRHSNPGLVQSRGIDMKNRPDLCAAAALDIEATVFTTLSETGLPLLALDGLTLPCAKIADITAPG